MPQSGRTLVEMLGVLAIVGVLTIGALAGFKQVMFKYKTYKQADQLSIIFNTMLNNLDKFKKIPKGGYFTGTLIKLGEIPEEMIKIGSGMFLYDSFGIRHMPYRQYSAYCIDLFSYIDSSEEKQLGCENVFKFAQKYSQNLRYITIYAGGKYSTTYYGNSYCTSNTLKCLKDIKNSEFDGICNYCGNNSDCQIFIRFWCKS